MHILLGLSACADAVEQVVANVDMGRCAQEMEMSHYVVWHMLGSLASHAWVINSGRVQGLTREPRFSVVGTYEVGFRGRYDCAPRLSGIFFVSRGVLMC
jgi:hypothetical protein